jgi:hypothetical protein
VHLCARERDARRAMAVLKHMDDIGVIATAATYNALLAACARSAVFDAGIGASARYTGGDRGEDAAGELPYTWAGTTPALELGVRIADPEDVAREASAPVPSQVDWRRRALEVRERMLGEGHRATEATFTAVITLAARTGDIEGVYKALDEAAKSGRANAVHIAAALGVYETVCDIADSID